MYINKLDNIVNKYNNTYHRTIKIKPLDVKSIIDFNKENNKKGPKFKVGAHVRISKYKNIFVKIYIPYCSEEVFVLKKLKTLCRGHILLVVFIKKKFLERFTKMICKKQIKQSLELKK